MITSNSIKKSLKNLMKESKRYLTELKDLLISTSIDSLKLLLMDF